MHQPPDAGRRARARCSHSVMFAAAASSEMAGETNAAVNAGDDGDDGASTCGGARVDGGDDGSGPTLLQVAQAWLPVHAHVGDGGDVPGKQLVRCKEAIGLAEAAWRASS